MYDKLFRFDARGYVHTIRQELVGVLIFVATIWLVFLLSRVIPLNQYLGLIPRTLSGLPGIVCLPFLHRDFPHIFNNSIPLLVLCTLLSGSRANSVSVVIAIVLLSGIFIWCFAPNGTNQAPVLYVGASALIFGLVTFLISSGIFERRLVPVAIAIVVGLMYGGTLFYELTFMRAIFSQQKDVSWSAHAYGAIAGVAVAFLLTHGQGRAWISRHVPQLENHLPTSRLG